MTLEEEKKLVAEKLMGWDVDSDGNIGLSAEYGVGFHFHVWCPNEERKWWDEIWDKMDSEQFSIYIYEVKTALNWGDIDHQRTLNGNIAIHTAKPEICWKALIKTLESK